MITITEVYQKIKRKVAKKPNVKTINEIYEMILYKAYETDIIPTQIYISEPEYRKLMMDRRVSFTTNGQDIVDIVVLGVKILIEPPEPTNTIKMLKIEVLDKYTIDEVLTENLK